MSAAYESTEPAPAPPKTTLGSLILGALFCFGLPAAFTAIAPVSYLHLERGADKAVSAKAATCLFFCIPYRTQTLDKVTRADQRFHAGSYTSDRAGDTSERHQTKSEDEAYIVLQQGEPSAAAPDQALPKIEVPISPASVKAQLALAQSFLKDESQTKLSLFCVSNWKFAIIGGGLTSLLAVLYVAGIVWSFLAMLKRLATGG